jgi:antitoxin ChpS
MLTIPPVILEALGLTSDTLVDLMIDQGALVIRPVRRRYRLDELLAQCDPTIPSSDEDLAWLTAPSAGQEI